MKEIFFLKMGSSGVFEAQVDGHGSSLEVSEVRTLYEVNNFSPNTAESQ
jgi:hypothetical protein